MILSTSLNSSSYSFFDKLKAVDYFLIIIVAIIGSISVVSIYSTESGNFSFYTKNHLTRFLVFFSMFLVLSFVRVSFWYRQAYIFYILGILLGLLCWKTNSIFPPLILHAMNNMTALLFSIINIDIYIINIFFTF